MKKFLDFAKYIKIIINFFGGFKKFFETAESFREHLESFEQDRQRIWSKPKSNTEVSKTQTPNDDSVPLKTEIDE